MKNPIFAILLLSFNLPSLSEASAASGFPATLFEGKQLVCQALGKDGLKQIDPDTGRKPKPEGTNYEYFITLPGFDISKAEVNGASVSVRTTSTLNVERSDVVGEERTNGFKYSVSGKSFHVMQFASSDVVTSAPDRLLRLTATYGVDRGDRSRLRYFEITWDEKEKAFSFHGKTHYKYSDENVLIDDGERPEGSCEVKLAELVPAPDDGSGTTKYDLPPPSPRASP